MSIVEIEAPRSSSRHPTALALRDTASRWGCPFSALCSPGVELRLHASLAEIDRGAWNQVARHGNILLRYEALAALEPGQDCRYATFLDDGRLVGVARFRAAEFIGPSFENLLTPESWWAALARWLGVASRPVRSRIAVGGSALVSTVPTFAFSPEVAEQDAGRFLAQAAQQIQRQLGASGTLCESASERWAGRLADRGYSRVASEPSMSLVLDHEWTSFDDYLASLASKYRVKARRAYAKASQLEVRRLSVQDLEREAPRLKALYHAVVARARFRLGCLDTDQLPALQDALGEALIVQGSYLGEQLVGFLTGVADGETLSAGIVGFDHELNRPHSIYPRMLYDYVRIALELGSKRLDFGRTAAEIKSTVGAIPVETFSWARHRNPVINTALPSLLRRLELPAHHQRLPFKKNWYSLNRAFLFRELGPSLSALRL